LTKSAPIGNHKAATGKADVVLRRGGRPSKAEAEQLADRIVDAATELFLTSGYGATSIEAVARRAQISKRTFYHRFENKSALFSAVVHRMIERLRPPADVPLLHGANLTEILRGLADPPLGQIRALVGSLAVALTCRIRNNPMRTPEVRASQTAC
jgi:AcrR family transcriptional regulator